MQAYTGFITLVRFEFFRFMRLVKQTVFPPILTTLLFILIFGFSLGGSIRDLHGFPYILYIIPGLAAMGVMTSAFSNTSNTIYMSRFDQSIYNILSCPLKPTWIVSALVIGGMMRGFLVGAITLLVALLMLGQPLHNFFYTLVSLLIMSVLFGCWGIIGGLRAKTWDTLATTQNFIITPMVYLGGVFYSIELLPEPWKTISTFNPIFYIVDGLRYGVLGIHDAPLSLSLGIVIGFSLSLYTLCVYLFHVGYKLVK